MCDDFSIDGTREKLQDYASDTKVKILYNEKNIRQAFTRNKCIEVCSGQFIMMEDVDGV